MKTELLYLALVTAFTGLLWVPYILDRVFIRGLMDAVGYPENPKPQSAWAQRLMKAHANAVENLVVFAPLVWLASATGVSNPALERPRWCTSGRVWFTPRSSPSAFRGCARCPSPSASWRRPPSRTW